jgi:hypothetical protein
MSGTWSLPPLGALQLGFAVDGVTGGDETSDYDHREQSSSHASATGMGLGSSCSTSALRSKRIQRNHFMAWV